ncbi:MAG: transporter, partial [Gemmatimonadota bacterium]|nr:transporter [Gemmatimonadota bacterium]
GYNSAPGANSSHVGVGDLGLLGQYRFTQFHRGSAMPTISFVVQENLPTGKYDELGDKPGDGMGSGAYKTTVSLYSQTYFWIPTGRILRARLNASESFSTHPDIRNVSVYGTPQGFRGSAKPGNSFFGDLAGEYSLTRNWVLAMDLLYVSSGRTYVSGLAQFEAGATQTLAFHSGSSMAFGFVPAVEYNFTGNLGVIAGARIFKGNRSTVGTTTPVVAINFVR